MNSTPIKQIPTKQLPFWKGVEKYKPLTNPFEVNAMCGGFVFLDIGPACDFVLAQKIEHVWTLTIEDRTRSTRWSIGEAMHSVNRAGYFVTGVPWDSKYTYYIKY